MRVSQRDSQKPNIIVDSKLQRVIEAWGKLLVSLSKSLTVCPSVKYLQPSGSRSHWYGQRCTPTLPGTCDCVDLISYL